MNKNKARALIHEARIKIYALQRNTQEEQNRTMVMYTEKLERIRINMTKDIKKIENELVKKLSALKQ